MPLLASVVNRGPFLLAASVLRRLEPRNAGGILSLATLPFAFFFVAVDSESLFLPLAVSFLWALRDDRCRSSITRRGSAATTGWGR